MSGPAQGQADAASIHLAQPLRPSQERSKEELETAEELIKYRNSDRSCADASSHPTLPGIDTIDMGTGYGSNGAQPESAELPPIGLPSRSMDDGTSDSDNASARISGQICRYA